LYQGGVPGSLTRQRSILATIQGKENQWINTTQLANGAKVLAACLVRRNAAHFPKVRHQYTYLGTPIYLWLWPPMQNRLMVKNLLAVFQCS